MQYFQTQTTPSRWINPHQARQHPLAIAEQDTVLSATLFCPGHAPARESVLGAQAWKAPSHDKRVSPVVPQVFLEAIPHSS